jgi:hypothetical protein
MNAKDECERKQSCTIYLLFHSFFKQILDTFLRNIHRFNELNVKYLNKLFIMQLPLPEKAIA